MAVDERSARPSPAAPVAQAETSLAQDRAPVHVLYFPDFPEERIRVGAGWADFGIGRPRKNNAK